MPPGRTFQKAGQEEENTPLVTILETKVDDKTAKAQDKRGTFYTIRLDKASFGGIHYPVPGSRWYVKKIANEWVLMARGFYQNPQLGYDFTPEPGDTFIGQGGTTTVVGDLVITGSGGGSVDPLDIYPVDSIYLTLSNSFDPNVTFGGTWVTLEDAFLVGAGNLYDLGDTGGEATHILTTAELPNHTHAVGTLTNGNQSASHSHTASSIAVGNQSASHTHTGTTNSTGAHVHGFGRDQDAAGGSGQWHSHSTGISGAVQNFMDANSSAGAHTHTMTTGNQSASHDHALSGSTGNQSASHTHTISGSTASAGSDSAHNNLPPFLAVYMWRRTA